MSIKPVTREILGKRITGVIAKKGIETRTRPVGQFFLLFDDETYFELYSAESLINTGGDLPEGDFDFVRDYGTDAHQVIFAAEAPEEINDGTAPASGYGQQSLFEFEDHEEEPDGDFGFSDLDWLEEEANKDVWPVDWHDFRGFFKRYATVWNGHHELEWFAEAWGAVLKYFDEDNWENRAEGFFMASALVKMYYGYCEQLGEPDELDYSDFMQVAGVSIGALVRALSEDFERIPIGKVGEKAYDILVNRIAGIRGMVNSALVEHWGSVDRLFLSLWNANRAAYERESWDEVMNIDISPDKMAAYAFVEEGMSW